MTLENNPVLQSVPEPGIPMQRDFSAELAVVVSDEDRSRIASLIQNEEERELTDLARTYVDLMANKLPFYQALRDEGEVAARVLLGGVNKITGRLEDIIEYLEYCAGPRNAIEVLDFMHTNKERAENMGIDPLLRTLRRTATPACIPGLIEYASYQKYADEPTDRPQDALSIALAAEQRAADAPTTQLWQSVVAQLSDLRDASGARIIPDEEIETLRAQTTPASLDLQWTELFYTEHRDTSMNYVPTENPPADLGGLNTLRNLYSIAERQGLLKRGTTLANYILERLVSKERPSRYAVTLGIEIEVKRQSLLAGMAHHASDPTLTADARLANLNRIAGAGVPTDSEETPDVIREFALSPAAHYSTLLRVMQLMTALGGVVPNSGDPLHVTIGNISMERQGAEGAFLLARCIEATGWSCTGKRLRLPVYEDSSWANTSKRDPSVAGLSERRPEDIQGDAKTALEFKTLSVESLAGLEHTLRGLYTLGTALSAQQHESSLDDTQIKLQQIWSDFAVSATKIFTGYGFAKPDSTWEVAELMRPNQYGHLGSDFAKLADYLDLAQADPFSTAGQFQSKIQQQIINSGRQVLAALAAN